MQTLTISFAAVACGHSWRKSASAQFRSCHVKLDILKNGCAKSCVGKDGLLLKELFLICRSNNCGSGNKRRKNQFWLASCGRKQRSISTGSSRRTLITPPSLVINAGNLSRRGSQSIRRCRFAHREQLLT